MTWLKLAPWAIIAALAFYAGSLRLTVAHQEASITRYGGVMALTAERIAHNRAQALANDLANARATETRQAKASQETESALLTAMDLAHADAARHAAELRRLAQAARNDVSEPRLPYAPDATRIADAASGTAELDDLRCAASVIKAEGWQTFWRKAFPGDPK